jgi:pimeloyl-ACP methyl ester carboxylesterase
MVRDAGDPQGVPVVYFHGTPGSRLDVSFGDELATGMGVRVISLDRPGYGRSDPGPFGLSRIASDAEAMADGAGVGRFAALGWSGGGPFALAASAVLGERVTRVGVVAGEGPVQQVPGARDRLDANDLSPPSGDPLASRCRSRGRGWPSAPPVGPWRGCHRPGDGACLNGVRRAGGWFAASFAP